MPGPATFPAASDTAWLVRSVSGALVTTLPLLVISACIAWLAPTYYQHLAVAAVLNLIIVVGLQVFMGNSGVAHNGHSAFVGLGAYGVAILATPVAMKKLSIPNAPFGLAEIALNPWLAALIALCVVAFAAIVTGRLIARLSGVAATIVSLALLIICHSMFLQWPALFKGNQAFFGIPQIAGFGTVLVGAVAVILIARVFRDSSAGLQLRATAQNLQAAESIGIDTEALRRRAWLISALICGAAGVLYAYFAGTISPGLFYFQQVFLTLAMLILGGMGTVTGAVYGAVLLSLVLEFIRSIESGVTIAGVQMPQMLGLSGVALGVVIVLCMAFRPNGITGRHELDELIARLLRSTRTASVSNPKLIGD